MYSRMTILKVTTSMASVVKGMDRAMESMNLEKVRSRSEKGKSG